MKKLRLLNEKGSPRLRLGEAGAAPLLILVAILGVLAFLFITNTFSFKSGLFANLFPKPKSQATGVVDVSLKPSIATVNPNDTFTLDVVVDTKTAGLGAATLVLKWDPAVLQATSMTNGTLLKTIISGPNITTNGALLNVTRGISCTDPLNPDTCTADPAFQGIGTLASVTFKVLAAGNISSQVTIDPAVTTIAGVDPTTGNTLVGDIKGALNPADVNVTTSTIAKTATFSLSPASGSVSGTNTIPVKVNVLSDTEGANFFLAKLTFDKNKLEVDHIDATNSFITLWTVSPGPNSFDNSAGTVSLSGGVGTPGLKTTGTAREMATIFFKPAAQTGAAAISFDGTSAILQDAFPNADILNTTSGASIDVTAVAPPPTPTPTPTPTNPPATTPPATTPPATTPPATNPPATTAPTPTPTPAPIACTILGVTMTAAANPAQEGDPLTITVNGNGDCSGQTVAFRMFQDNGLLPAGTATINPGTATFGVNNTASATWLAEYQQDGFFGLVDPPEWFVRATLADNSSTADSDHNSEIKVNKRIPGNFASGDFNRNGRIDIQDMSVFLSHYDEKKADKTVDFSDALDLEPKLQPNPSNPAQMVCLSVSGCPDGTITALDWSALVAIVIAAGALP